ncbi:MAG: methyltransferase [Thermomicrobiales bacterium]
MINRHFDLLEQHWFKKEVSLSWNGVRLSLAVAQELFSSHVADAGSLLLLGSLDQIPLATSGTCVDYGCGYGILGLAFKAAYNDWQVTLIDRDALAVEFSSWNADRLKLAVQCVGGLDLSDIDDPPNLVLWNVPGKAGSEVLERLTSHVLDRLANNGTLALVVVHPLAQLLEAVATARPDIDITHESAGTEHTVFHMKRIRSATQPGTDTFVDGAFDREQTAVDTGLLQYQFTPVVGLPQYEGPDFATVLMTDCIEVSGRAELQSALCIAPGQGHVPIYLRQRWPNCTVTLVDRDLLALRASRRTIETRTEDDSVFAAVDYGLGDRSYELIAATLPNQIRPEVSQHLLTQMRSSIESGAHLILAGGSTEVSRFIALVRKHSELKLRNRDKRKGFSAALFERR